MIALTVALLAILGGVELLAADQLCTAYSGLPSDDGDKLGMGSWVIHQG